MIHSDSAIESDFTMSVLTQGVVPELVEDERHGHDRAAELMDRESREEHESEACSLWAPAAVHDHGGR